MSRNARKKIDTVTGPINIESLMDLSSSTSSFEVANACRLRPGFPLVESFSWASRVATSLDASALGWSLRLRRNLATPTAFGIVFVRFVAAL